MTLTIRPATPADLEPALELLRGAKLPTADLCPDHLALVAEYDSGLCGVIGLESSGNLALLRSLVTSPGARGTGIGKALVAALETLCTNDEIAELWLLTIDADEYFGKLGYEIRSRADAPQAIRQTAEFSGLCPGDAILMSKRLSLLTFAVP